MSGIHPAAPLAVSRILIDLRNDLGNVRTISGTGFWLHDERNQYFITNRHNVDPTLKLGADTTFRVERIRVLLRMQLDRDNWGPKTDFVAVDNFASCVHWHESADVAILKNPKYQSEYAHSNFTFEELATENFLKTVVHAMDVASFIGYPGDGVNEWWDSEWNLGIARTVYISSWPAIGFTNKSVSTSDVVIVNGLSFSGSSGSPLLSHLKPQPIGALFEPVRILGIMSGHWQEKPTENSMFTHSGFSYFTTATAIHQLIASANLK